MDDVLSVLYTIKTIPIVSCLQPLAISHISKQKSAIFNSFRLKGRSNLLLFAREAHASVLLASIQEAKMTTRVSFLLLQRASSENLTRNFLAARHESSNRNVSFTFTILSWNFLKEFTHCNCTKCTHISQRSALFFLIYLQRQDEGLNAKLYFRRNFQMIKTFAVVPKKQQQQLCSRGISTLSNFLHA